MSGRRKTRQPALSADDVAYLNAQFYGAYPFEELGAQVTANALMLQPTDEFKQLLTHNIPVGKTHVRMDEASDDELKMAGAFGVLSVSQHIAETLLRLLQVHAAHHECPWIALVKLREPAAVQKIARGVLNDWVDAGGRRRPLFEVVADVCLGSELSREAMTDDQITVVDNSVVWVREAATLASGASIYNAYKHGMGLVHQRPLPMAVSVGERTWVDSMDSFMSLLRPAEGREHARCDYVMDHRPVDAARRVSGSIAMLLLIESTLAHGANERGVGTRAKPKSIAASFTPQLGAAKPASPFEIVRDVDEFGGPPALAMKRPSRDIMKVLIRRRPEAMDDPNAEGNVTIHVDPEASRLR